MRSSMVFSPSARVHVRKNNFLKAYTALNARALSKRMMSLYNSFVDSLLPSALPRASKRRFCVTAIIWIAIPTLLTGMFIAGTWFAGEDSYPCNIRLTYKAYDAICVFDRCAVGLVRIVMSAVGVAVIIGIALAAMLFIRNSHSECNETLAQYGFKPWSMRRFLCMSVMMLVSLFLVLYWIGLAQPCERAVDCVWNGVQFVSYLVAGSFILAVSLGGIPMLVYRVFQAWRERQLRDEISPEGEVKLVH